MLTMGEYRLLREYFDDSDNEILGRATREERKAFTRDMAGSVGFVRFRLGIAVHTLGLEIARSIPGFRRLVRERPQRDYMAVTRTD